MSIYYPPVGFHFRVEFDLPAANDRDIRFQEVSGLTMELEEETVNEGGENRFVHKLPGRARYPDLVLKRGLLTDTGLKSWLLDAMHNHVISPTTIWVSLLNEASEPLRTFTILGCWPKKWVTSDLNAENSQLVIETLEMAYQYFRVEE